MSLGSKAREEFHSGGGIFLVGNIGRSFEQGRTTETVTAGLVIVSRQSCSERGGADPPASDMALARLHALESVTRVGVS
jgi:hypothetical protein